MTALRPTEAQCEDRIIHLARLYGWRVHAERPARSRDGWRTAIKGDAGWPDLVLAHPTRGRLLIVELKRKPAKPTDEQTVWLDTLRACGVDARLVYVPEELASLETELAGDRQ